MGIYKLFERFFLWCIRKTWFFFILIHELKNIFKKRHILSKVKLTDCQKKEIDEFYKESYGKKVRYWWHRLYQSYTGIFDANYLPEYIFSLWLDNDILKAQTYSDKNMIDVLFNVGGGAIVATPKTYVMKVEGRYYDGDRKPVTKEAAIQIVNDLSKNRIRAVLKVTVDSSSGRGVRFLDLKDGVDLTSKESIEVLFEKMGNNLVLQESIRQHPQISQIYPHSINTMRVITYQINDDIFLTPIVLRIGRGGNKVDNAHAGGMFVGVKDNGKLCAEAYTEYQERYLFHPDTRVAFDGYQLPFVDEIKRAAVELHKRIPMFQFVNWDFTVNDDNKIVLIEVNLGSSPAWITQMAHGRSLFGDNTAAFLKQARKRH